MNKEILECYLESTRVANKLSLVVKYVAELYDQQKRLTDRKRPTSSMLNSKF